MLFLIFFFPFLNFLLLFFFGSLLGFYGSVFIVIFFLLIGLFLTFYFFLILIKVNGFFLIKFSFNFIYFSTIVNWVFVFDSLTFVMLVLVLCVSLIVHLYSSEYMEFDIHIIRFLSLLSLFTFFMFFLITSSNFIQLFFGWEGVGLCSYLLINFWFTRIQANKSSIKAMLVNKIGDISLLFLICLLYFFFQTIDFSILFNLILFYKEYSFDFSGIDILLIDLINFLIIIAAVGKSAQLFLHTWLPDAMEGPTPVSALIHAATMVTAGIFILIKFSFLLEYSSFSLLVILIFGVLTSIFSGLFALVQFDLKKIVAYSTCSQLGFMMIACGLSRYDVALFHLFNHGFFKALLFLSCGAVIHALGDEQDIRKMGNLFFFLPFTYLCFLIGSLSLIGFPFFTGFYSKEIILTIFFFKKIFYIYFLYILSIISVCLTSIYSFRLLFYVFFSSINGSFMSYKCIYDCFNTSIFFSLVILLFCSVFIGFIFNEIFIGFGSSLLSNSIYFLSNSFFFDEFEFINFIFKLVPLISTVFGFLVIYNQFFFKKVEFENFIRLKNFFLLYNFLSYKGYFDLLYNFFFVHLILKFSFFFTFKSFDKNFFELFGAFGSNFFISLLNKNFFLFFFNSFLYNYLFFLILGYFGLFMFNIQILFYVFFCLNFVLIRKK